MTFEEKLLLLKDLCARLPYGVVVELDEKFRFNKGTHTLVKELLDLYCVEGIKPYLRPMSSMTEEEKKDLQRAFNLKASIIGVYGISSNDSWWVKNREEPLGFDSIPYTSFSNVVDWLNAHHFDYHGLIEKGLAIDVTEEYNPYK